MQVREKLNASGREFAYFLNTSRQTLNRVETGRGRFGPEVNMDRTREVLTISEMDMDILLGSEGLPADNSIKNAISDLKLRNRVIELEISMRITDIVRMAEKYEKARYAHSFSQIIVAKADELDLRKKAWLNGQVLLQSTIMEKNCEAARFQVQVKIAQLETEMKMNQEMIAGQPD